MFFLFWGNAGREAPDESVASQYYDFFALLRFCSQRRINPGTRIYNVFILSPPYRHNIPIRIINMPSTIVQNSTGMKIISITTPTAINASPIHRRNGQHRQEPISNTPSASVHHTAKGVFSCWFICYKSTKSNLDPVESPPRDRQCDWICQSARRDRRSSASP